MRIYDAAQEEALLFRSRARSWRRAGLVTAEQCAALEEGATTGLKTTSIFFRGLLFFFAGLAVSAVFWFSDWAFNWSGWSMKAACAVYAALCYAAAEYEVRRHGLYRHGVEEALAAAALGWSSAVVASFWLLWTYNDERVLAVCAWIVLSGWWLQKRFGFLWAGLAALAALAVIPFQFHSDEAFVRLVLAAVFSLLFYVSVRTVPADEDGPRREARTFFQTIYIFAVYLSMNVRLSALGATLPWVREFVRDFAWSVPAWLHWFSYAAVIAIPAGLLTAGIKLRRRLYLDAGLITAGMTLAVNKDYWGLRHFPWDPAIFGAVLAFVGWKLSRRLRGRKTGFTSDDLWRRETHGLELAALGASALAPAFKGGAERGGGFSGGQSGGGGASGGY